MRRTARFSERLLAELARRAACASSFTPPAARAIGAAAPAGAAMGTDGVVAEEERSAVLAELQMAMDDADEEQLAVLVERADRLGLGAERLVAFCRKLLERLAEQRALVLQ